MSELIVPDQLPAWVPGRLTVRSPDDVWTGAATVRGYRYDESDVEVPALRDYVVVAYRHGTTDMHRVLDAQWSHERLGPGDVSLLTRATESHWTWTDPIDVVHVYLSPDELTATCRQMYDREVSDVALHDTIKADDPAIHRTAMLIAAEAARGGAGSSLLVESLTCQLSVNILRRHADVVFREPGAPGSLTSRQEHAVRDHVHARLHGRITLDDLAAAAGLSKFHFARRFRATTGTSPHEFVVRSRVDRARRLLEHTDTPLAAVAEACGFADQSHMNRVFAKRVGATPGEVRRRR